MSVRRHTPARHRTIRALAILHQKNGVSSTTLSFSIGASFFARSSSRSTTLSSPMPPSMDRKRKLDLGDNGGAGGGSGANKVPATSAGTNPWTNQPYSKRYSDILAGRLKLPVYQFKDKLLDSVANNQIVVVEGETGSGEF